MMITLIILGLWHHNVKNLQVVLLPHLHWVTMITRQHQSGRHERNRCWGCKMLQI